MKKSKKICISIIGIFLSMVQFTNLMSLVSFAEEVSAEEQTIYTGECGEDGDNVIWTYDAATKTMTFSGTGAMRTYVKDLVTVDYPEWVCGGSSVSDIYDAKHLVFEEGITDLKTITRYFFSKDTSGCTMTIPESVTSMDLTVMPAGIKLYGKYGSWFYYQMNPNTFHAIGVAENEYVPSNGISKTGFEWHFDYLTRILTVDGTDAIGEDGYYACTEIELIYNYAKAIVIGEDFILPTNEEKDAKFWDVPGASYAYKWAMKPTLYEIKNHYPYWYEINTVYCYNNSNFANTYEALREAHKSDYFQSLVFPERYEGRVVYIDDPDEVLVGDVNLDGKVDLMDAIWLNKHTANIVQLTDAQKTIADCDGDGSITDADVATLMEYLMFQIPSLPYQA